MRQKTKKVVVSLSGFIGLIALLVGILTDLYPFSIGLIIAIGIWIGTGAVVSIIRIKGKKQKKQQETPLYDSRCREALKRLSSDGRKPGHY